MNKPNIDIKTFNRDLSFRVKETESSNQFELSFSSEEPYLRSFGYEILSHKEGAVDLSRLQEIGIVLFNHDSDKVIGKITKAWIENKRGKALIEFDTDKDAQIIADKVKSGTLKGVSVGYSVLEWAEGAEIEEDIETWIATKWAPYEISIVSIPADATVGVNRSLETDTEKEKSEKTEKSLENDLNLNNDSISLKEYSDTMEKSIDNATVNATVNADEILKNERARVSNITDMCRKFDIDASEYIASGASENEVRSAILDKLAERKAPANVTAVKDNTDDFKRDATDALIMRAGCKVEKATDGAKALSKLSLRDLAVECLAHDGVKAHNELRRMSHDELFTQLQRAYYNPTSAFPAILDNAMNKNIVEMYNKVPTTFQYWCTKGSVSDFKETKEHNYLINALQFEKVGENGEIKHSKVETELLPTRKIDSFATSFTLTRQAFINDDIGFLAEIPFLAVSSAKRKINKQVYELLVNNGKIYDGVNLFDAKHGNLAGTGSAPTLASINELMLKMQAQKDPFGNPINITPRMLVLPIGHGLNVDTLLHSTQITTTESNNTGYNPLANRGLTYVEEPLLNSLAGSNPANWFLVADTMTAKSIQIDYLNGVETPTIRRSESANQLGFTWDFVLDWGINVLDFRGIAKNAGVKVTI